MVVYGGLAAVVAPPPADSFDPTMPLALGVVSLSLIGVGVFADRFVSGGFQTLMIVRCAMAESIALFGFILIYLGGGWSVGLPFFLVGGLYMLVNFPSVRAHHKYQDAQARKQRLQ